MSQKSSGPILILYKVYGYNKNETIINHWVLYTSMSEPMTPKQETVYKKLITEDVKFKHINLDCAVIYTYNHKIKVKTIENVLKHPKDKLNFFEKIESSMWQVE